MGLEALCLSFDGSPSSSRQHGDSRVQFRTMRYTQLKFKPIGCFIFRNASWELYDSVFHVRACAIGQRIEVLSPMQELIFYADDSTRPCPSNLWNTENSTFGTMGTTPTLQLYRIHIIWSGVHEKLPDPNGSLRGKKK